MTDPAQSEVIALRAQVAELTRDRDHQKERNESHLRLLERYASIEGKEHLQTIDERDSAEQAISQAYYLIKGESPQWSNLFGYEQALEDIDDAQKCFRAENAELRAELVTLKGVNEVLMRERNFDPGAGNVLAGFIEHRGRIQVDNDRLRAEVERLSWKPITPESVPEVGHEMMNAYRTWSSLDCVHIQVVTAAMRIDYEACRVAGFTHYRPINPPASTKGEDNGTN